MNALPPELIHRFVNLVEAAEDRYPFVDAARLRRLVRSETELPNLAPELARFFRLGLASGLLLAETRMRVSRSGRMKPVRVYRLNRAHPAALRT